MEYLLEFTAERIRSREKILSGLTLVLDNNNSVYFWRTLQGVCKHIHTETAILFKSFYSIPYMLEGEVYTERQRQMIIRNRDTFQFHTSWFLSLARHNCVDLVNSYSNCNVKKRRRCRELKCPPLCSKRPDAFDSMFLLSNTMETTSAFREKILTETKVPSQSCLPYLLYNSRILQVLAHLKGLPPGLASRGVTLLPNIEEKLTNITREEFFLLYEIYLAADGGRFLNGDIKPLLLNFINPEVVTTIKCSFGCIRKILFDPSVRIENAYKVVTPLIEMPIFIGGKLLDMSIMTCNSPVLKLSVLRDSTAPKIFPKVEELTSDRPGLRILPKPLIDIHIAISSGWLNAYITSYCAICISHLSKVPIALPRVVVGDCGSALLIMPPGSTDNFRASELYDHYGKTDIIAIFVMVCYLLGINTKYIMISEKGIVPIDFDKLYDDDKIRLGDIISSMGGRNGKLYKEFAALCASYYIKFRAYYKQVVSMITLLRIPRHAVDSRFMPMLTDNEAIAHINDHLKKCGDYAMRGWSFLGF